MTFLVYLALGLCAWLAYVVTIVGGLALAFHVADVCERRRLARRPACSDLVYYEAVSDLSCPRLRVVQVDRVAEARRDRSAT